MVELSREGQDKARELLDAHAAAAKLQQQLDAAQAAGHTPQQLRCASG